MEYHKVGEKFEYEGVMLEVVERTHVEDCKNVILKMNAVGISMVILILLNVIPFLEMMIMMYITNLLNNVKQKIWNRKKILLSRVQTRRLRPE